MAKTAAYRTGSRGRPGGATTLIFATVLVASACSSPTLNYTSGNGAPPGPSPLPVVVGISVTSVDPEGDAPKSPDALSPPDLVGITVQTDRVTMTVTVRFAAGWDPSRTTLDVYLDTDQNTGTGLQIDGIGAEYDLQPGALQYVGGVSFNQVVTTPVVTVAATAMTISFPFGYIGDDGFMNVRARASRNAETAFDALPDVGLPPIRLQ